MCRISALDYLGQLIQEKCAEKTWIPVKASRSGPAFSHLFFADDLLLFARANPENCATIRGVLDVFCSQSGQTISEAKSRVFFSPNLDKDHRDALGDILGFQSTPNLGRYLGFPLKHRGASSQDFNFVLEKVKKKLAGWKANLLSMAGRAILIQASTSAIPAYVMQNNLLPGKILDGIDRVNKNFLWNSSSTKQSMHWVGWRKVTSPKEIGGLGLQTAKGRNTALLAKLNWRFHTEGESQWAKVLRLKYCTHQRLISRNEANLPGSRTWKSMKKGKEIFRKGTKWIPGYESNLSFWNDSWSNLGTLRNIIQGPLTVESSNLRVKDVADMGGWKWDRLHIELPEEVKREIQATPIPFVRRNEDRLAWKLSPRGSFELKSAYLLAIDPLPDPGFQGKWIWKLDTLPRIQMFLWKCMHQSIGVKECLQARGMLIDTACPHCLSRSESILHALRDCHVVKKVWHQLGVHPLDNIFFSSNLQEWLVSNCSSKSIRAAGQAPWNHIFMFAVWLIWQGRNKLVFENKRLNPKIDGDIVYKAIEYFHCAGKALMSKHKIMKQIKWDKPTNGWRKLNVDGASMGNSGMAGGGGLLRDDEGSWLGGFARRIGFANSFNAELWALRDGLMLCNHLNVQAVNIELDAKSIVDAINVQGKSDSVVSSILEDCRHLIAMTPQTTVTHVFREANRSADCLANLGLNLDVDFILYSSPPVDLIPCLEADCRGLYSSRICFDPGLSV